MCMPLALLACNSASYMRALDLSYINPYYDNNGKSIIDLFILNQSNSKSGIDEDSGLNFKINLVALEAVARQCHSSSSFCRMDLETCLVTVDALESTNFRNNYAQDGSEYAMP